MEKLKTKHGNSYWNENGAYQKEYDELYEKLVPRSGEADTVHGEMIRAISRITYDYFNNGNCNIVTMDRVYCPDCDGSGYDTDWDCYDCSGEGTIEDDEGNIETCNSCGGEGHDQIDCSTCCGEGFIDGDKEIDEYYQDMLDVLHNHLHNSDVVEAIEEFLKDDSLSYGTYTFNPNEGKVYNDLADEVLYQILTTENEKRIIKNLVE